MMLDSFAGSIPVLVSMERVPDQCDETVAPLVLPRLFVFPFCSWVLTATSFFFSRPGAEDHAGAGERCGAGKVAVPSADRSERPPAAPLSGHGQVRSPTGEKG